MVKRMVKRMVLRFTHAHWSALATVAMVAIIACSTSRLNLPEKHELPFAGTPNPSDQPQLLWKQNLEGKLTDLSVAAESGQTLLTQVLDNQTPPNLLSLRSPSGDLLWSTKLESPVRSQAISSKGDWIVIGTYEDELIGIDPKNGASLWKVEDSGMCRPMLLEKSRQVLCFHDDDAIPGVGFTVFDAQGQRKLAFKVPGDPLLLKISRDESLIVLGLVKGRVWLIDGQFNKVGERQLDGEIVDISVAATRQAEVQWSALINVSRLGQKLVGMGDSPKARWEQLLELPHQQVELSADGSQCAVYGNGPRGQSISSWGPGPRGNWVSKWSYRAPRYADYNQRIDLAGTQTILGFEEVTANTRHSHVLALSPEGKLTWDIPFMSEEGAYLYARGITHTPGLMVVGTDDGQISAYRIR